MNTQRVESSADKLAIAVLGVMLIALPTGLFAASFTEVLDRERTAAEAAKADRKASRDSKA